MLVNHKGKERLILDLRHVNPGYGNDYLSHYNQKGVANVCIVLGK
jgi:hypothetical protein